MTGVERTTGSGTSLVETLGYDDAAHTDLATSHVTAQGQTTAYGYDEPGNLAEVVDPLQGRYAFTHNPDGTLATATDPAGGATAYGYDQWGNRTSAAPPAPLGEERVT